MSRLRVGIDLCRTDPAALRPRDHAVLDTLGAVAAAAPDDVELVLFASTALRRARPELFEAFEAHTAPFPPSLRPVRVAVQATWLPAAVRRAEVDLLHDAGGTAPGRAPVPTMVSVPDLAPFDRPGGLGRLRVAYHRWAVPRAVDAATAVVVPSAFVRDRLVEVLGVDADKIRIAPWPLPPHPEAARIEMVRARHGIVGQIVLLAASTNAEQEHLVAVRAMRHLAPRHGETTLVLLGGEGPAERQVAEEIEALGVGDRVVRVTSATEPTRAALFEHAAVVVHPSVYDSFPAPVLEAMACGVPVVVADAGAAPELVGSAGAVIPPGDDAQLAIEVHRVLDDPQWRQRMVDDGLRQARAHTPAAAAEALLATYRSVMVGL